MTDLDVHLPAIAAGDEEAFAAWLAGGERRVRLSLRSFAAHVDTEALLQETLLRVLAGGAARQARRPARRVAAAGDPDRPEPRRLRAASRAAPARRDRRAGARGGRARRRPPPDRAGDPFLRQAIVDCHGRLPARPARALDARLESAGSERDVSARGARGDAAEHVPPEHHAGPAPDRGVPPPSRDRPGDWSWRDPAGVAGRGRGHRLAPAGRVRHDPAPPGVGRPRRGGTPARPTRRPRSARWRRRSMLTA